MRIFKNPSWYNFTYFVKFQEKLRLNILFIQFGYLHGKGSSKKSNKSTFGACEADIWLISFVRSNILSLDMAIQQLSFPSFHLYVLIYVGKNKLEGKGS